MNLAGGRPINDGDFREDVGVCDRRRGEAPALCRTRGGRRAGLHPEVPFTVIGELAKKDQNNSYNGLDGDKVLIPYTVMAGIFPTPVLSSARATWTISSSCPSRPTITKPRWGRWGDSGPAPRLRPR